MASVAVARMVTTEGDNIDKAPTVWTEDRETEAPIGGVHS